MTDPRTDPGPGEGGLSVCASLLIGFGPAGRRPLLPDNYNVATRRMVPSQCSAFYFVNAPNHFPLIAVVGSVRCTVGSRVQVARGEAARGGSGQAAGRHRVLRRAPRQSAR